MFSLKVLGGALLEGDCGPVQGKSTQRRRLALLAVLAAERRRPVPRERLVRLLWMDADNGRHLVTESLRVIRRELGEDAVATVGDQVSLNPLVVRSDLQAFEEALERAELEEAVRIYHGPFLAGLDVSRADEFERWVDGERARLARSFEKALETLAERSEEAGDPVRAAEWWTRLSAQNPESSRITVRLMQALEAAGECAAAIRQAEAHNEYRRREGLMPHPDIEAYAGRLRAAPARTAGQFPGFVSRIPDPPSPRKDLIIEPDSEQRKPPSGPTPEPNSPVAPNRGAHVVPLRRLRVQPLPLTTGVIAFVVSLLLTVHASTSEADPTLLVVLPFASSADSGQVQGGDCALLLYRALDRWNDLELVDVQQVRDVTNKLGVPNSLEAALRIARNLGAGTLVWGRVERLHGDSTMVFGAMYDVAHARILRQRTVTVTANANDFAAKIAQLAGFLVVREVPAEELSVDPGTSSLAAWRAYEVGRLALLEWELPRARAALARAVAADRGYAHAYLLLAQAVSWSGDSEPEHWREFAARAVAEASKLTPREQQLARALLALGEERYPDACREYETLLARDSTDVAAWFGLGECHGRDPRVEADPRSPSGWSFRGSHHRALEAYGHALRIAPESHRAFRGAGFARLTQLLRTESRRYRKGRTAPPEEEEFGAFPGLQADTLTYIPYPLARMAMDPSTRPATQVQALLRSRTVLRDVARTWAAAFRDNADAHEAFALALETLGEIHAVPQGEASAASELARARELAVESDQRLRLAIAQVRLYVKVGEFDRAKMLADSVLAAWPHPGPHDAQRLAPLAALTGRVERTRELLRQSSPEHHPTTPEGHYEDTPEPVTAASLDVLVYSAFGLFGTAVAAERAFNAELTTWIEPGRRAATRSAQLNHARRLGFDARTRRATGPPLEHPDYVVGMQQQLAVGDIAAVRSRLRSLRLQRAALRRPGDIDIDFVLPEAELSLAAGDTSIAIDELNRSLNALEAYPTGFLDRPQDAAALVRAMALYEELTGRRGSSDAARWRRAVRVLWRDADPALQRWLSGGLDRRVFVRPSRRPAHRSQSLRIDLAPEFA